MEKLYTQGDMQNAYEAGEARVIWLELSSGQPEAPDFCTFMHQHWPENSKFEFVLLYGRSDNVVQNKKIIAKNFDDACDEAWGWLHVNVKESVGYFSVSRAVHWSH